MDPKECCICLDNFDWPFDGASNSDIETECEHYFCVRCLHKMFDNKDDIMCPLCRRDISEWWYSHHYEDCDDDEICCCGYPNYDEDDDEDYEDDEDNDEDDEDNDEDDEDEDLNIQNHFEHMLYVF